ncbi:hypothetical protein ScPMuIL_010226 [Solemya velum]
MISPPLRVSSSTGLRFGRAKNTECLWLLFLEIACACTTRPTHDSVSKLPQVRQYVDTAFTPTAVGFFEYVSTKRILTKHASLDDFQGNFNDLAIKRIHDWENTYTTWFTNFSGPAHLVIYDHMLEHLQQDLAGMAEFLHFNYTTKDMCCTIKKREGRFHRGRSRITPKTVYTADIIDFFENSIDRVLSIVHNKFPTKANYQFQSIRKME